MAKNKITLNETVDFLKKNDFYLIAAHANPDGDTLGSAYALCFALRSMGKRAKVALSGKLPERYAFLAEGYTEDEFEEKTVVAVDIASESLFGENSFLAEKTDLCIDHHGSNSLYAEKTFVDAGAAANCENIYRIICALNAEITREIATCIYTGIATDTGCFKYSNTTRTTHEIAGEMMELGIDFAKINYEMFDLKTKQRLEAERIFLEKIEYYFGGRCALAIISKELVERSGIDESEFDGLSSIPRQIEGVDVGATLKERDGGYKISLRSSELIDVSEICKAFGGGGHLRAAGCFIKGTLSEVRELLLKEIGAALAETAGEE